MAGSRDARPGARRDAPLPQRLLRFHELAAQLDGVAGCEQVIARQHDDWLAQLVSPGQGQPA